MGLAISHPAAVSKSSLVDNQSKNTYLCLIFDLFWSATAYNYASLDYVYQKGNYKSQ